MIQNEVRIEVLYYDSDLKPIIFRVSTKDQRKLVFGLRDLLNFLSSYYSQSDTLWSYEEGGSLTWCIG